ncbi:MAG: OmpA family protein [Haliscomenobacter sp.]|nr:OmpA family protein [Haliscomenobacter sp.]MBK8655826.1 OmpA family protein [Haliscomenobacter sp.]MBP9076184.1 OmpA family protein [Haliscomenobacter sp.]
MRSKSFSRHFHPAFIWMLVFALFLPSCSTHKRTVQGAVIGAAAGGVIGGVLAKKGKTAKGVLIGAAIGGVAGAAVGAYMDKQAREIQRDLKNAKVERVGEGILITFDSGLLFDVDSYALRSTTRSNLNDLAKTLNKYGDTNILVQGHTDNTGAEEHNQTLSENRARAVSGYLQQQKITPERLNTAGFGESEPIAGNDSASGRQQNRRVEVAIYANKKLIRAAKKGTIPVSN